MLKQLETVEQIICRKLVKTVVASRVAEPFNC